MSRQDDDITNNRDDGHGASIEWSEVYDFAVSATLKTGEQVLSNTSRVFNWVGPSVNADGDVGWSLGVPVAGGVSRHYHGDGEGFTDTSTLLDLPFLPPLASVERRTEDGWMVEAPETGEGFFLERLKGREQSSTLGEPDGPGHNFTDYRATRESGETISLNGATAIRGNLATLVDEGALDARLDHVGVVEPTFVVDQLSAMLDAGAGELHATVASGHRDDGTP
jgi:hypothetical protein